MSTTKNRINISVPRWTEIALEELAGRDNVPVATKTLEIIEDWLEMQEDMALARIVDKRVKAGGKYLSHEEVWKQFNL
ncbi:MAG: hypothetical protein Q7S19_02705 [bacterium]|nr:hypothetical protein [bacterium]